jgi:ketosteroid isomerase-like protein
MKTILLTLLCMMFSENLFAITSKKDYSMFNKIFSHWTEAFNQQNLQATCDLFSKSLVADYQGAPQKTYHSLCKSFEDLFQRKNVHYHYSYQIHDIYRKDDLAAVRITWYLTIDENRKKLRSSVDQGLDVFKRESDGQWRIVNYIAYPD